MIISRLVKELLIRFVHSSIVLARSDLEVRDPGEFSIYVSLLTAEGGPRGHTGSSNSILLVGVQGLLRFVRYQLLLPGRLVKVLLER